MAPVTTAVEYVLVEPAQTVVGPLTDAGVETALRIEIPRYTEVPQVFVAVTRMPYVVFVVEVRSTVWVLDVETGLKVTPLVPGDRYQV